MFNKKIINNLIRDLEKIDRRCERLSEDINGGFWPKSGINHKINVLQTKMDLIMDHLNVKVEDCPSKKLVKK